MPAARYWRVVGVQTYDGGDLELSELQLYDASGRIDSGATLTATMAPVSGSVSDLQDDDTDSICIFSHRAVRAPGFALMWEFGADTEVFAVRPGSGVSEEKYLARLDLQYLDSGGVWVSVFSLGKFQWPGVKTMDFVPTIADPYFGNVATLLPMNGSSGSTSFPDVKGLTWTPGGGAQVSTAHSFFGTGVGWFQGSDRITTPHSTAIDLSTGDFTIEFLVRFTTVDVAQVILNKGTNTSTIAYQVWVDSGNKFGFRGLNGSFLFNILGGTAAAGTDYFVSARRSGSTFSLHVNNTLIGTAAYAGALLSEPTDPLSVGAYSNGVAGMRGYMGQFRITGGIARSVAVPTAPWPTSSGSGQEFDPLDIQTVGVDEAFFFAQSEVPTGVPTVGFSEATVPYRDFEFGGFGRISGTVKRDADPTDIPLKRRVRLHREQDGLLIREVWSDPATGAYSFEHIDATNKYTVITYDYEHNYRAVIADNILPELMP